MRGSDKCVNAGGESRYRDRNADNVINEGETECTSGGIGGHDEAQGTCLGKRREGNHRLGDGN